LLRAGKELTSVFGRGSYAPLCACPYFENDVRIMRAGTETSLYELILYPLLLWSAFLRLFFFGGTYSQIIEDYEPDCNRQNPQAGML